jgi:uncharacterized membrane protein
VVQLDDRQQRWAYIGAVVAAVGFTAAQVPHFPDAVGFGIVGLLMAAFLAWAAQRRSVVLAGGAAFVVSFGPWGFLWFLGAPYIALGALLMFRASKQAAAQREPRPPRQEAVDAALVTKRPPGRSKRYTPPATRAKRNGGT